MDLSPEAARAILRERVCSVCTDRLADGSCGLSASRTCAFDKHLDQIVGAVNRVRSPHIQDYVDAIRSDVCTVCEQDEQGQCEHRSNVECALDAYVILVVEAIEEARNRAQSG